MSNPNLIAEQRPDKNGNVVTRWVKSVFGGKDSARYFPAPVSAPPSQSSEVTASKAMAGRWQSALDAQGIEEWHLPKWANDAIESKDTAKLNLVEKFGSEYDPELIHVCLEGLRNKEDGEADHLVTTEVLDAMTIMDQRFPRTEVNAMVEDDYFAAMREERLRTHVLHNPESAYKVDELFSRGIHDPSDILDTISSAQNNQVATPLNDGIL